MKRITIKVKTKISYFQGDYQCMECGAYAKNEKDIQHWYTCTESPYYTDINEGE